MLTTDAADSGLTGARRREDAYVAARRYLSLTAEDMVDLSVAGLRERLLKCRALLTALVETSHSNEPLARTVDEAAASLGVSRMTVYRLINSGDLAAYRIWRRSIRVDEAALRSYLAGHVIGAGGITGDDIPERHIQAAWR